MFTIGLVLLVFALVFAALAAMMVPNGGRVHWGWLALAIYLLSLLIR